MGALLNNLSNCKELTPSGRICKDARFSRGDFFAPYVP